ncbi:MAG: protein kinase domain-containing protein, partial [Boseongicola sp.]
MGVRQSTPDYDFSATIRTGEGDIDWIDEDTLQKFREYRAALERGDQPDRAEVFGDIATNNAELSACLDALEFVHEVAPQLAAPTAVGEVEPLATLGDFRIVCSIGRGGMGVVYEAEQLSLGRSVALKVLPYAAMLDKRALQRFKNEVTAAAQLDHPNIVDIYSVGCERGVHHYAMRLINGLTVSEVIRQLRLKRDRGQDFPEQISKLEALKSGGTDANEQPQTAGNQPRNDTPDNNGKQVDHDTVRTAATGRSGRGRLPSSHFRSIAEFGAVIAEALDHAHHHGVVHRDVKPSNLLIDSSGKPWVTDFGLAQVETGTAMTMTGDILGTARYMSPEQILAKRVFLDHRTDVYSLGATLYELLTLRLPFDADDRQELFQKITFEEPTPLRRINPDVPEDLQTVVLKCLEKNPDARYASAEDLAADLRRFGNSEPIVARRARWSRRLTKWAARHPATIRSMVVVFAVVSVVATAATILVWQAKQKADQANIDLTRAHDDLKTANAVSETSLERTERILDQMIATLRSPGPDRDGRSVTVAEVLDEALKNIEGQFADDPVAAGKLLSAIGETYMGLRDANALIAHEKALRIFQSSLGDNASETLREVANTFWALHFVEDSGSNRARFRQMIPVLQDSLRRCRDHLGEQHETTHYTMQALIDAYKHADKIDEAAKLIDEISKLPVKGTTGSDVLWNLGMINQMHGRDQDAIRFFQRAVELAADELGSEARMAMRAKASLAITLNRSGKSTQALPLIEEVLRWRIGRYGPSHSGTIEATGWLCETYLKLEQPDEATRLAEKMVREAIDDVGATDARAFAANRILVGVYRQSGKRAKALSLAEQMLN